MHHIYKHVGLEEGCSGWVCHLIKKRQEQARQQTWSKDDKLPPPQLLSALGYSPMLLPIPFSFL